jgi:membrane protease YdiL (CAAX protease family)
MRVRGIVVFVALSFVLSWIPAWLLEGAWRSAAEPTGSAFLRASALYVAVLGWQPIIAVLVVRSWIDDERAVDHGLRAAPVRYQIIGLVAPLLLLGAAAGLDALLWSGVDTGHRVDAPATWIEMLSGVLGLVGIVSVLWLQAFSEELGWRGYLLGRLMRQIGPWPGLVAHGALWGLWYAPVFLVGGDGDSMERMATFVVTCALLGTILGWLRLASRSILVSAASNAVLTITAGLPLVLQGASSARTAIYEPSGWIPMIVALLVIAAIAPLRSRVTPPSPDVPASLN